MKHETRGYRCFTQHKLHTDRQNGRKMQFFCSWWPWPSNSSEGPNTSSAWIWRKSVQRFRGYFIHRQKPKTDGTKNRTLRSSLRVVMMGWQQLQLDHMQPTFCVRHYVIIETKPVHRLQICPTLHNYRAPTTIPPSYIRVCAVMWECGEGQTDTQTDTQIQARITNIHFASSTTHTKCNNDGIINMNPINIHTK